MIKNIENSHIITIHLILVIIFISNISILLDFSKKKQCPSFQQARSQRQNTNYDQIATKIANIRDFIAQESKEETQRYQIIAIKLKIIEQRVQQSKIRMQIYEKECLNKVQCIASLVKDQLKSVNQLYLEKESWDYLEKDQKDLQLFRDKSIKSNNNLNQAMAKRVERQIDQLKQRFDEDVQSYNRQRLATEKIFKRELEQVKEKLKKNSQQDQSNELIKQLEILQQTIDKGISALRSNRKQKKQKFLLLLETIIIKCKDSGDNE